MADWTTVEVARLLDMRRRGLTTYAIAHHLGRSEASVRGCIARHGANAQPRWDEAEVEFLTEHYTERGAGWCAERLCRTVRAVGCKARRLGLQGPCAADGR